MGRHCCRHFWPTTRTVGTQDFVDQLGVNSFPGSSESYDAPAAKVTLYHFTVDSLVPSKNTDDMINFLNNGSHKLASVARQLPRVVCLYRVDPGVFNVIREDSLVCALYMIDDFLGSL